MFAGPELDLHHGQTAFALVVVVAWTAFRVIRHYPYLWRSSQIGDVGMGLAPKAVRGTASSVAMVLLDAAVLISAVLVTDQWESPFALMLVIPVFVAGLADGFALAVQISGLIALTITAVELATDAASPGLGTLTIQWIVQLGIAAVVSGAIQRMVGQAQQDHTAAFERLSRLQQANTLLSDLHRVTQQLPVGLDLESVLDATLPATAQVFGADAAIMLLPTTPSSPLWRVARSRGARVGSEIDLDALPAEARRALADTASVVDDLTERPGTGLSDGARSALYARLGAPERPVGLLVLESAAPGHFDKRQLGVVDSLLSPVALAIDNAMWFARVRRVGADEERTRLARELHDRVAQSVAFLGFELDRLARAAGSSPLAEDISRLRVDVRTVVSEIRSALYELRSDVDESRGLVEVITEFADRVMERSNYQVTVVANGTGRLPLLVEREVWRIAQEAMVNAERHGRGDGLTVSWSISSTEGVLEVVDNGIGFATDGRVRADSFGLLGMRERADAIDAELSIATGPAGGTRVRCRIPIRVAG